MPKAFSQVPIGTKRNRWEVIGETRMVPTSNGKKRAIVECRCECGGVQLVRRDLLLGGESKSCGCLRVEETRRAHITHNESKRRLYTTRRLMLQRCHNPNHDSYPRYGARGIVVCDEWRESYEAFRDWSLANGYADHLEIDRIDGTRGYSPDNCRWVGRYEQCRNLRNNHWVAAFGETKLCSEWGQDPRCVVHPTTLRQRLLDGVDPETAITTPGRQLRGVIRRLKRSQR